MSRITLPFLKSFKRIDTKSGRRYEIKLHKMGMLSETSEFTRLSTTTRLHALHSENLVNWRVKQGEDIHKTAAMLAFQDGMDKTDFLLAYEQRLATEKARRKENNPATLGDEIHRAIEQSCVDFMEGNSVRTPTFSCEAAKWAWWNWMHWAEKVRLKPYGVEVFVYGDLSAGTLDFVGEIEEHIEVADWKTGGMYPEYDLQIADYSRLLADLAAQGAIQLDGGEFPEIDGAQIVQIPKGRDEDVRPRKRNPLELAQDECVFNSICDGDTWNRGHAKKKTNAVGEY